MEVLKVFLESSWSPLASAFGLLLLITGLVRKYTKDYDKDLSKEARAEFTYQLERYALDDVEWVKSFNGLINYVYGERHFSWKCLSRSFFVTTITFVLLGLILGVFIISSDSLMLWSYWILVLIAFGLAYNGILDYFSLLQTRLVLKTTWSIPVKIISDMLLTSFVVCLGYSLIVGTALYFGLVHLITIEDTELGAGLFLIGYILLEQFLHFPPEKDSTAFVIFCTSFTTTLWLILHITSMWIIRVVPKTLLNLNLDEYPVRSIGVVINLLLTIVFCVFCFVYITYLAIYA